MKKNDEKWDPFKNLVLDEYEQDIEDSIARGEWVSVLTPERKKELQEAAHRHIEERKSESVTFRIQKHEIDHFKAKAHEQNIPYQTLLGSVISKYNRGKLVEL